MAQQPSIYDIPEASTLQLRLDTLLRAIAMLGQDGATVPALTVTPPLSQDPAAFVMPIAVQMNPPISNPSTLASLVSELQVQADDVTQQLLDMGYGTDQPVAEQQPVEKREATKPEWWPEDVPWPPAMPPAMPPAIPGRAGLPPRR